jgi:hypothetical protein
MEPLARFEPATFSLPRRHSNRAKLQGHAWLESVLDFEIKVSKKNYYRCVDYLDIYFSIHVQMKNGNIDEILASLCYRTLSRTLSDVKLTTYSDFHILYGN